MIMLVPVFVPFQVVSMTLQFPTQCSNVNTYTRNYDNAAMGILENKKCSSHPYKLLLLASARTALPAQLIPQRAR